MNLEAFKEKLESVGLGKYYEQLLPFLRNSIRLHPISIDEGLIPVGQTKIGGRPDLPKEMSWVTETNIETISTKKFLVLNETKQVEVTKPLSFIAQINLAEIAPFDEEQLLPKTGMLYFFYSALQEVWGLEPEDRNKFRVVYHDVDITGLRRMPFPEDLPEEGKYVATAVAINQQVSITGAFGMRVRFDDEEDENKFTNEVYAADIRHLNKLFGYADEIQGDMELDCERIRNDSERSDELPGEDEWAQVVESWKLLLQIDSNPENNMMWGDAGLLYFWIRKDDLLHKRFDNAWFQLQCS